MNRKRYSDGTFVGSSRQGFQNNCYIYMLNNLQKMNRMVEREGIAGQI